MLHDAVPDIKYAPRLLVKTTVIASADDRAALSDRIARNRYPTKPV
jgi:hypothetical protein